MEQDNLKRALLAAASDRPLEGGESPDQVEAAALRVYELLRSMSAQESEGLVEEAIEKLANPRSSLRKLEKKVRQAALAMVSDARLEEAAALAPEIVIEDLRGTLRFSISEERTVEIDVAK